MNLKRIPLLLALFVVSCRENPPIIPPGPQPPATVKSVFVLNEGNFGDPAGARLSVYDVIRDTVYTDVYESANGNTHLGSTGDDMKLLNGKVYVLMSGSENLNIISSDNYGLLQSAVFPGAAPHDLLIDAARNRMYLTKLYSSSVLVVDLPSLSVVDSVDVGSSPQGMALDGNYLFVCNSGYGSSKTMSVIDVRGDSIKKAITLINGPTGAVLAPDGKLWVCCTGNAFGAPSTSGKVFIVNTSTLSVEDSVSFAGNLWGSIAMGIDGYAYVLGITNGSFYGGPLHRISLTNKSVTSSFIAGTFYGMAVEPSSGDIYLADARDFTANGEVLIYTKERLLKKRFPTQRGPAVIAFKN